MRRGGVGGAWEEGESVGGGARLREGVDRPGILRDEEGGGVEREFGSAPVHVKGFVPSFDTTCAQ